MAAIVKVYQINGEERKLTEIDGFSFKTIDVPGFSNSFSIKLPKPPNVNYSFWVSLCLGISGTFNLITNIRIFFKGEVWDLGTNGALLLATKDNPENGHGIPLEYYDYARGQVNYSGVYIRDQMNGHSFYKTQTAPLINLLEISEENAILIDNNIYTPKPFEQFTYHAVLQLKIDYDASTGILPPKSIVFMWDEL